MTGGSIASILATALDTSVFFSIAFMGTEHSWWRVILVDFCAKLVIYICMLGPIRVATQSFGRRTDVTFASDEGSLTEIADNGPDLLKI